MTRRVVIHNEFARALDAHEGVNRVPVRSLRTGDALYGSGEKVVGLTRDGSRVNVTLAKNNYRRLVSWDGGALVSVIRRTQDAKWLVTYREEDTPDREFKLTIEAPNEEEARRKFRRTSTAYTRLVSVVRKAQDGVGTPEEIAYGEGWHSTENVNPYTSAAERAEWEKGRAARKQKYRMNQHTAYQGPRGSGMKKKVSFEPPKQRVSNDFKSEKGFVGKLIDAKTGGLLAKSEPYISNGQGLKTWIQAKANELIKQGKRVKAEVVVVFFDPEKAYDV